MATTTHIQRSGRYGRNIVRLLIGAAAIALGGYAYGAASRSSPAPQVRQHMQLAAAKDARSFSYGWPVKPFDKQHPVRGSFGDPRSVFHAPPTRQGLLTGSCSCSYHQGIDVAAPDGTPVYPVRSGVVRIVAGQWIEVDSGNGAAFQYWHIKPLVRQGDHVSEDETVLGRIVEGGTQHVHLTQLQDNKPVNPLAPGNIGPYTDTTTPQVGAITFRASDTGPDLLPEYLHGRVEIVASAWDATPMAVAGIWRGLPVTPARLTFRMERLPQHLVVVGETTAMDVRHSLPFTPDMWHTYARGTRMNFVQMATHRYWFQPGVYLFKLTTHGFDTTRLRDGAYLLTVTAYDTAGNHSSSSQVFSVHNRPTWLKG
jgi:murein DD-endopeptidase MepM/ murein hydrolase activator NlpD